jgi:hypothetical protein
VHITLFRDGEQVHTTLGSRDAYGISDIVPGTYVITVIKGDCVPLTAELILGPGETVLDLKVCVPGDITGDNRLNIGDVGKIYSHVRGSNQLQDAYALLCADYTGDGTVNIGDVGKLYNFVRQ